MRSRQRNKGYGRERAKVLDRLDKIAESKAADSGVVKKGLQFDVTSRGVKLNIHSLLRNNHAKKIYSLPDIDKT